MASAHSNHEIARALVIGEGTVKMHVSTFLDKSHLADRTQGAMYAPRQRLVPLDEADE